MNRFLIEIQHHLDGIDPDRQRLGIGFRLVATISVAEALLSLTPLWPAQLVWAAVGPLFFLMPMMTIPAERRLPWALALLLLNAGVMLLGSLTAASAPWYVGTVALVGLLCGLGLRLGPSGLLSGSMLFVLYAAASDLPGGYGDGGWPAVGERLLTLGLSQALAFVLILFLWPLPAQSGGRSIPHLFWVLAQLLRRARPQDMLRLQDWMPRLFADLSLEDPANADSRYARAVRLRNAVAKLAAVRAEVRKRDPASLPPLAVLLELASEAAADVLDALADGRDETASLRRLTVLTAVCRKERKTLDESQLSAETRLQIDSKIYAIATVEDVLTSRHCDPKAVAEAQAAAAAAGPPPPQAPEPAPRQA